MPMAPEGRLILLTAALFGILGVSLGLAAFPGGAFWIAVSSLLPLAFCLHFFRDPARHAPEGPDIAVAPADGRIIQITEAQWETIFEGAGVSSGAPSYLKISIFMSPLNVHVNRIPVGGIVAGLKHQRGKFAGAFTSQASAENERQTIRLDTPHGPVGCVQVAGWLARRIVCHLREGQQVTPGQRFGIIKFGSRVDLYLPASCHLLVRVGQKTRAGETVIARLSKENIG
jgi:phosphatidylserine decarboxylase